jgi:glycosyltransferase involved in cell wall biosynthesis
MKILAYTPTYVGSGHNAGAETTLHGLLSALKRQGHDVMALASRPFKDGSQSYVAGSVMVQAYSSKRDPELYFPGCDLIITQFECAQRAWYIGDQLQIPTVQVVHNNTEYATNLAVRYNTALVYNAEHVQRSIDEAQKETKGKIKPSVLVRPIIDPEIYRVETSREYITLVNLSDGTPPFYNKGYEIFYHLAEKFPDQKFLGVKGAYGEQVVREMENVTIWEHQMNPLNIYRQSKIILMPSEIESWGRVAIEAACSGIPSLTSTAPGLVESNIGHDQIPWGRPDMWEEGLEKLLGDYDNASYSAEHKATRLHLSNEYEVGYFLEFIEEVAKRRLK